MWRGYSFRAWRRYASRSIRDGVKRKISERRASGKSIIGWGVGSSLMAFAVAPMPGQTVLPTQKDAIQRPGEQKAQKEDRLTLPNVSALSTFFHGIWLTLVLTPCIVCFALWKIYLFPERALNTLIKWSLIKAGATWIKFGQWMSTRPDLFDPKLCAALGELHSNVPFHAYKHTEATLKKEYGPRYDEIFESFDKKPLHSGCVAQIYRAVVRPGYKPYDPPMAWYWKTYHWVMSAFGGHPYEKHVDNRVVAIKVLHPKIRERFAMDLRFMTFMARAVQLIPGHEWFAVDRKLAQFSDFIEEQLDMRTEAHHLKEFCSLFRNDPSTDFPHPYLDLVTPSILVESFVQGPNVDEWIGTASVADRKALAKIGLKAFLSMLFKYNYTHSDLHPGNVIVQRDEQGAVRMVCVDAGLVTVLSDKDWNNFVELYAAVVAGDAKQAATLIVERAPYQECTDRDAFVKDMSNIISKFNFGGSLAQLHAGTALTQILHITRKHKVMLDSSFTSLVVAIVVLEGLGVALDPNINVVQQSYPYVIQWGAKHPTAMGNVFKTLKRQISESKSSQPPPEAEHKVPRHTAAALAAKAEEVGKEMENEKDAKK